MWWTIPLGITIALFWMLVPAIIETIAENKEAKEAEEDEDNDEQ